MKRKYVDNSRPEIYREIFETYLCTACNNSFSISDKNSIWINIDENHNLNRYSTEKKVTFERGIEYEFLMM